ncbi:MAG: hypothetical protein M1833_005346 [Piccolia ochrophora]|nr:MAG: hypothetical protein M1833_005346 [Piccolia ochrophora]
MAASALSFIWATALCVIALCFSSITVAAPSTPEIQFQKGSTGIFPSLINVTTEDLAFGLDSGRFTSVDLVKAYLSRIEEVNPTMNVVTEVNPDAIAIAEELDNERKEGKTRGPLHGIPILIKNNIATFDKMNNTAGSYALLGATVPRDSGVAAKLRAAGVVILGKANLSQWANGRCTNAPSGWSALGGQVFGAYYAKQAPSGSSSGSAVASALGLALATLGTETSASILSPSEVNNVVGIKPTVGLTSRSLVIPISQRQDTVGPMARTVKDAAYLLSAIAGKDENDNYTSAIPYDPLPDYVAACNPSAFLGARIGIPRNGIPKGGMVNPILAAFEAAIALMTTAGATVIDNANFPAGDEYAGNGNDTIVLDADFVSDLPNLYFSKLVENPNNITSLSDLVAYTRADPREEYPARNTRKWDGALRRGIDNTSPEAWAAYQVNLFLGGPGGVLGALEKDDLDALILPTAFAPGLPALVGYPVVTVPLGFYPPDTPVHSAGWGQVKVGPNIPFGISFLGRPWSETTLIALAYAFEQRTLVRNRVQPYITPVTEVVVRPAKVVPAE